MKTATKTISVCPYCGCHVRPEPLELNGITPVAGRTGDDGCKFCVPDNSETPLGRKVNSYDFLEVEDETSYTHDLSVIDHRAGWMVSVTCEEALNDLVAHSADWYLNSKWNR